MAALKSWIAGGGERWTNRGGPAYLTLFAALILIPAGSCPAAAQPSPTGAQRTLTVPESFGDYKRLSGSDAEGVIQAIRKAQSQQNPAFAAKMKIAVYERRGDAGHRIAFIGLAAGDDPTIARELRSNPPSAEVDSALKAMPLSPPKDYPAGPLGGTLRCAGGTSNGAGCAWADGSTVGVVAGSASSADDLARTTLALRTAAEH